MKRHLASAGLATVFIMAAGQPAFGQTAGPEIDRARGVASYNNVLTPILPAIPRIVALGRQRDGSTGPIGSGSGVVIDAERGLILTNHHVVTDDQLTGLRVDFPDGRSVRGELVGKDEAADIAIIRVALRGLKAVPTGRTDDIRVGDVAIAVGYPFALDQTVTVGVISGLGRDRDDNEIGTYLQTDAPINSGNSGGPLLDTRGRLIGINTAIRQASERGGNVGIGFAVPIDDALFVMREIVDHGEVRRGRIAITTRDFTPDLAGASGIADTVRGAFVTEVAAGGPGAIGGIKVGDVLTMADGRPLRASRDLRNYLGTVSAGTEIRLAGLRDGKAFEAKVRVRAEQATERPPTTPKPPPTPTNGPVVMFGAQLEGNPAGLRVVAVQPGSPAAQQNIAVGDIITRINAGNITTTEAARQFLASNPRAIIALVTRGADNAFLAVFGE
jgi:serine protease DegQ